MVLQYILIGVLLVAALFIVVISLLQKSGKEGLSGTIVGGTETYYGKDDSIKKDKKLAKWTAIIGIIFALAVAVVYIIQPNYETVVEDTSGNPVMNDFDSWLHYMEEVEQDYADIIESDLAANEKA
ncbi:MAG: preprotein translocase subunit SecG [Clostridia bacterium]|nr:preprotein translocase subunit SecG [Clostridia bacterium]